MHRGPRLDIARGEKITAWNAGVERGTGLGVVAACWARAPLVLWPPGRRGEACLTEPDASTHSPAETKGPHRNQFSRREAPLR